MCLVNLFNDYKYFFKIAAAFIILLFSISFNVSASPRDYEITYENFLKIRDTPDVVVLDAAQLEKYFMVVPEELAQKGKGLSQKQLDVVLAELIPTKDTKVILYCYQSFMPTRNMPASLSVAMSLRANGYQNIYELEYLWMNGHSEAQAQQLGEKEIIPYAKKIPEYVNKGLVISKAYEKIKIWPVSAFIISNEADEGMIGLKSAVKIQHLVLGKWQTVVEGNLFDMTDKAIDCYNLSSNSSLTIGPWDGMSCLSASCDKNIPLPDGTYRFMAVSCDGKEEFITPSFKKSSDASK